MIIDKLEIIFILVMLLLFFKVNGNHYTDSSKHRPLCFAASCILEPDKEPCYLAWNKNDTQICNGGAICKVIQKRYLSFQVEISASCDYICRPEVCRTDLDSYSCTKQCCTEDYCNNMSNAKNILPPNNVLLLILSIFSLIDLKSIFDNT